VSSNTLRNFGRTRLSLLQFQESRSGRYFGVFSYLLAPTGDSLKENGRLLLPIYAFIEDIITNTVDFVK